MIKKICIECKKKIDETLFERGHNQCKKCISKKRKLRHIKNREKDNAQKRKRWRENTL